MNLDRPIAFLDLESTGIDPAADRILEFAVAVLNADGTRGHQWAMRFNPGVPIPAAATAVHGITDADAAQCLPFSAWGPRIVAGLEGKDMAGYNLRRFDLPMLDEELRLCGLKLKLDGVRVIDCFGIFSKKEPRNLSAAVRKFCGREHEDAHGAAADAAAALDVFHGLLRAYPDLAEMSAADLAAFSVTDDKRYADLAAKLYIDDDGDLRYAFGKHRDCKVRDFPGFADWMLSRDFPGSTCEALEAELRRCFPKPEQDSVVDAEQAWGTYK